MGRESGFIAASDSLAQGEANYVLVRKPISIWMDPRAAGGTGTAADYGANTP
jgi:hypothetical protein